MPKLIDKYRVMAMLKLGFTQKIIAQRCNCSTRQVRRYKDYLKIYNPQKLTEKEIENSLRDFFLNFESGERVSERFGITRQAILK